MLYNHLILCLPLLLLPSVFSRNRVFSNELDLCIRWPKYWSFSFSISSSNEYSGLFPLGLIGLISLQCKGLLRAFPSTAVQKHQFFQRWASLLVQTSRLYTTLGETRALTLWTLVGKVMSLLFNTLSRFVIAFLPRRTVFNFMASVTVHSDFGV